MFNIPFLLEIVCWALFILVPVILLLTDIFWSSLSTKEKVAFLRPFKQPQLAEDYVCHSWSGTSPWVRKGVYLSRVVNASDGVFRQEMYVHSGMSNLYKVGEYNGTKISFPARTSVKVLNFTPEPANYKIPDVHEVKDYLSMFNTTHRLLRFKQGSLFVE